MDIEGIYHRQVDTVYRVCMMHLQNREDAQDCVQNTFINLMKKPKEFESFEHEKAWLIVTASNLCKSQLTHWFRKKREHDPDWERMSLVEESDAELLHLVFALPTDLREVIYLYYYEGYSTKEIASMLNLNHSTLRSRMAKARELLRLELEEKDETR